MKKLTAASRITVGLVCSMLGILVSANLMGLLPDRNALTINARKDLAESIAFSSSVLLANNDVPGINAIFSNLIERQPNVRSIGIRRTADRQVLTSTSKHSEFWPSSVGNSVTSDFMPIPLSQDGSGEWGQIEVAFSPLDSGRWYSFAENPFLQLLAFSACSGFMAFRFFLRLVLKNLDPSRAVPRRVREALDILTEGLMIVGLDDRILLANNAMAKTVDGDADAMVGKRAGQFRFVRVDGMSEMPWTECGRTRQPLSGTSVHYLDAKKTNRIFKVNCSPLFGAEGRIRGIMVSLDDVTTLEQNKIDLRIAKDEADNANKAKSDFLANMSHEIRNPMNAIVGFTDILRRGLEDNAETRTRYLDTIYASGTHLVELINDILDFSKIEAGKLEMEIRECVPYELMTDVANVLHMKAEQQNLSLSVEVRGEIPETINSDPTRLRQVLMNLVSNAIKFTSQGNVHIVASSIRNSGQDFVRFEVTDTGIGMTKEQMGRLFQEFMQADSSVTRRFGGTGLGLAISKRLTEALGGQIAVDSEPGVGSTFHFCVATGDIANVAMLTGEQAFEKYTSGARTTKTGLSTWFKPARVLITDDTLANRQLAGLVLRKAGLMVDEAENGEIAVEKATTSAYDLLLMDMQMPVMDGFTATSILRRQGLTIPVLAFTANVSEHDRRNCIGAGCTGFLTKPINIDLLLSTIAEYLPTQDYPPESIESTSTPVKSVSLDKQSDNCADERTGANEETLLSVETTRSVMSSASQRVPVENVLNLSPATSNSEVDDLMSSLLGTTSSLESKGRHTELSPDRCTLHSSLPMDIPEFREIVEVFISELGEMLQKMRHSQTCRDYQEIRELAHRLKGTGGTVGFREFTEPSHKLQIAADSHDDEAIEATISELEEIACCLQPAEVVTA